MYFTIFGTMSLLCTAPVLSYMQHHGVCQIDYRSGTYLIDMPGERQLICVFDKWPRY